MIAVCLKFPTNHMKMNPFLLFLSKRMCFFSLQNELGRVRALLSSKGNNEQGYADMRTPEEGAAFSSF